MGTYEVSLASILLSILPAIVLCGFLVGCITNHSYTQTGKGRHKILDTENFKTGEINRDSQKKTSVNKTVETVGLKQGSDIRFQKTDTNQ